MSEYGEAKLVHVTHSTDDIGQTVNAEVLRSVPVEVKAIGRAEWNAAGQQGLSPSMTLVTNKANYQKEQSIEYDGERYSIYRTYARMDGKIELYLKQEAGVS